MILPVCLRLDPSAVQGDKAIREEDSARLKKLRWSICQLLMRSVRQRCLKEERINTLIAFVNRGMHAQGKSIGRQPLIAWCKWHWHFYISFGIGFGLLGGRMGGGMGASQIGRVVVDRIMCPMKMVLICLYPHIQKNVLTNAYFTRFYPSFLLSQVKII